jgi:hypothetical protein
MARGYVWVYDPHSAGVKIPPAVRERTAARIEAYARAQDAGRFNRLDIRFRGALCYIDGYVEPQEPDADLLRILKETREEYLTRLRNQPVHLCRLRYFGKEDSWSMAFYTYSHERYEPCNFDDGSDHGTPEQGYEIGAVYLRDQ